MTEDVKDAKKGYEEYQAYLNEGYKEQEDLEEAVADATKYERYVKIFAHIILAIGIIYAAYNLFNIFEWASQADDYYMNSVQRGAAMGSIIGSRIGMVVENLISYVAVWIALTLSANASIRSKENEMKIDNMLLSE